MTAATHVCDYGRKEGESEKERKMLSYRVATLLDKKEGRKKGRGKRKERKILSDWVAALLDF